MTTPLIIALIVSFLTAFFFALVDYSYQAANKLQLELEGRLGSTTGRILGFFAKRPLWVLGTTLVGMTVSLVVFTVATCMLTTVWLDDLVPVSWIGKFTMYTFLTLISGAVLTVAIVVLPRMMRVIGPNDILSVAAVPFFISFVLFIPFTWPYLLFSKYVTVRLLQQRHDEKKPFLSTPTVAGTPSPHTTDKPSWFDSKLLANALAFKTVKIRDCMIPRTEISAVELSESIDALREVFVESGHSKVLVYKQNTDDIVGYCHSSSMFAKPQEIREILTPVIICAETNSANDLMVRFIREKKNLAVVMDEFGGTSGLVTMEDIIEEIFGRVGDEHNPDDEPVEQKIGPSSYLMSARLKIDHLNETYGWDLPTGEYETLGGLILAHTEDFPTPGQVVEFAPFTFTIVASANNRIEMVIVALPTQEL